MSFPTTIWLTRDSGENVRTVDGHLMCDKYSVYMWTTPPTRYQYGDSLFFEQPGLVFNDDKIYRPATPDDAVFPIALDDGECADLDIDLLPGTCLQFDLTVLRPAAKSVGRVRSLVLENSDG